jgi:hypothetical protein
VCLPLRAWRSLLVTERSTCGRTPIHLRPLPRPAASVEVLQQCNSSNMRDHLRRAAPRAPALCRAFAIENTERIARQHPVPRPNRDQASGGRPRFPRPFPTTTARCQASTASRQSRPSGDSDGASPISAAPRVRARDRLSYASYVYVNRGTLPALAPPVRWGTFGFFPRSVRRRPSYGWSAKALRVSRKSGSATCSSCCNSCSICCASRA